MDVAIIVLGGVASTIGGVIVTYLIIVSSQLAKHDIRWELQKEKWDQQNERWEQQAALWKKNEEDHQALVRLIVDVRSELKADIARLEDHIIRVERKIDDLRSQ